MKKEQWRLHEENEMMRRRLAQAGISPDAFAQVHHDAKLKGTVIDVSDEQSTERATVSSE